MSVNNQIPEIRPKHTKLKRRKLSKKTTLISLWVLALIIVGYGSFVISRNNALAANRPAEKALVALKNNNSDTVYELGTDEFKKNSDKNKVKSVVNEWSKVITQATDGKPQLVSKRDAVKDGKELTTLDYKYQIQPGKSKINQKELYVTVVTQKVDNQYKVAIFTIDSLATEKK